MVNNHPGLMVGGVDREKAGVCTDFQILICLLLPFLVLQSGYFVGVFVSTCLVGSLTSCQFCHPIWCVNNGMENTMGH